MGKSANELALRDPALAALMGVAGSDFGSEDSFGDDDFGADWENDPMALIGADMGDEYGDDFGGHKRHGHPHKPHHPAMHPAHAKILREHAMRAKHNAARGLLLEPNKYSSVKVERYSFSVNATITALGTAGALTGSNSPDVNFRPQRVTANVVSPGMVTLSDLRVANVSFSVGGLLDAWQF